jgi:type IV pilus assembly protein PilW
MIAMTVSSIILAAVYNFFYSAQRSYLAQDQVADMQQNLRAGLYHMAREIRSAGFDPNLIGGVGLVTNFAAPNDNAFSAPINYAVDTNVIAFTIDTDQDGTILSTANNDEEIAYRLNNRTLERYSGDRRVWEAIATNVDALNFVYLDANGNPTGVLANIRAVEISLLVRTGQEDKRYNNTQTYLNKQGQNICSACGNDRFRRRLLSTTVHLRNR